MLALARLGFWFGRNEQLVLKNPHWITLILAAGCVVVVFLYWHRRANQSRTDT